MHKEVLYAVALSLVLAQPAAAESERRDDLAPFNKIVARGAYVLEVREGSGQSVVLTAGQRDLDRVRTSVRDETLFIETKSPRKTGCVSITIDMEELRGLLIQGMSDARISGLAGHDVSFELNGAGRMEVSGTCQAASIEIKGAGTIDTSELACDRANVEIMGSADAAINATEEVVVSILGAGRLDIHGDPARVIPDRIRGSASVNLR